MSPYLVDKAFDWFHEDCSRLMEAGVPTVGWQGKGWPAMVRRSMMGSAVCWAPPGRFFLEPKRSPPPARYGAGGGGRGPVSLAEPDCFPAW